MALSLFDLKNKEVLVPSFTFISTINSIKYNGAKPVFVDIEQETLNLDPNDVEKKITEKTKMILPVYFGGMPADISAIKNIAKKNGLHVVSDAAHACGASFDDKKIGSEVDCVCFSFHPVKNLSMPKGGAITINVKNYRKHEKKLKSLRWCGISNRKGVKYDVTELGYNYYMDELSASIGIKQLEKIEKMNKNRFSIASQYYKKLEITKKMPLNKNCSYHLYWILIKNREKFRKFMFKKGIETGIHYIPAHQMKLYKERTRLPITEKISKEIVTLPIHNNLHQKDIDYIINSANYFINEK